MAPPAAEIHPARCPPATATFRHEPFIARINDPINHPPMPRRISLQLPVTHHTGRETHLVREVMRAHQAIVATFAISVGAPASRLDLLRLLAVARGRLGTNALARRLGVDPASVTRQLNALEAEGLVARGAHATDGRRRAVALTRAGVKAFRALHERGHAFERALAGQVTEREFQAALRVLQALRRIVLRAANREEEEEP